VLYMIDNIHLVEEDARVDDVECRIIQNAGEHDILEELQPVGMVDFPFNGLISDRDRGMEVGVLPEELPVIRFVIREFRVI